MSTRAQALILIALVAVLGTLAWGRRGGDEPVPAAAGGPPTVGVTTGPGTPAPGVGEVRLGLLATGTRELADAERNPFRFGVAAAPPAPAAAPPRPPIAAPGPAPVAARPTVAAIPLRYIGVFDLPGRPGLVAVLSDSRGRVFHGVEGDVIEGQYRVLRVGPESADLAYLDGRGQQTMGMSGQ